MEDVRLDADAPGWVLSARVSVAPPVAEDWPLRVLEDPETAEDLELRDEGDDEL